LMLKAVNITSIKLAAGFVFTIAFLTVVAATALQAQETPENTCFSGEYILSGHIDSKLEKQLKNLQSLTRVPLKIAEKSISTVLIKEVPTAHIPSEKKEIVPDHRRYNLCYQLERKWRREKLERERKGSYTIIRRPICSCNQVISPNLITPNDNYYSMQWALNNPDDSDIDAPQAWEMGTGSSDTIVAVIDTGVDYTHPDLAENMWKNPGELGGVPGVDDDGNGYIDDIYGINAINNSGNPRDDHGHGTHVAGTIGAVGNNGIGVAGVTWNVKMIAVKFLNSSGSGSGFNAIKSIDYITTLKNSGINVILSNNSWGGGGYYQGLRDAIARNRTAGILFVAAAGNSSVNNNIYPHYPASYTLDNIISVAATASSHNLAPFSNWGSYSVDLAAPGVSIVSTYFNNRYAKMSGTSMATPHVAGALALLHSYVPHYTWEDLRNNLLNNVRTFQTLTGKVATNGRLNVKNMLIAAGATPPPSEDPDPTPTSTPTPGPTPTPEPTPEPTPTPIPTPGVFTISGKILDSSGIGIAQAMVKLETDNETIIKYTGPNGLYSFNDIDGPVNYMLNTAKSGYSFEPVAGYLTSDREHNFSGQLRQFTLSGTVISPENLPIAGVVINAGELGTTTTDLTGRFSFQIAYGSAYTITASVIDFHFTNNELSGTILGDVDRVIVGDLEDGPEDFGNNF
jgi:subtilisin family serine protease